MSTLLSINNYHYYRGGAETVFLEHNRMFAGAGWNVVPFAMHHDKNLPTPWSQHFIEEIEFGKDYSLAQRLRRMPKVIYSFEARRKLDGLISMTRPDISHAHNIYHHISPSILGLLRSRGIPVALTLHDLKIACPAYSMLSHGGICERCRGGHLHQVVLNRCIKGSVALSGVVMLEAILHKLLGSYRHCVDRFVVPSRFYMEKLTQWGMPADRFRHVPNFVDATQYRPDAGSGSGFVYFGRLSREKGVATLIRAAAAARSTLTIVGTGPQEGELRALAASLGTDIRFLGYQTGEALHAAIRGARAVVLPSEWYENAPMSILEAHALGKPVIAANIGGIPELIHEGETGVTFESGNVDALGNVLQAVSGWSQAAVTRMGQQARRRVEVDFSPQRYCERIDAVYREMGVKALPFGAAAVPA